MSNFRITFNDLMSRLKIIDKRRKTAADKLDAIEHSMRILTRKKGIEEAIINKYDKQIARIKEELDEFDKKV